VTAARGTSSAGGIDDGQDEEQVCQRTRGVRHEEADACDGEEVRCAAEEGRTARGEDRDREAAEERGRREGELDPEECSGGKGRDCEANEASRNRGVGHCRREAREAREGGQGERGSEQAGRGDDG
jgi:hypothetical protein